MHADAPPRSDVLDTMRTRYSIVIAAFNAEKTLAACLRSALNQTIEPFEIIVVYTGSEDLGRIAARTADRRVVAIAEPRTGIALARNVGISRASGDVVCFLDSDDLLLPDYLESIELAFNSRPNVDWAYTNAWVLDDETGRVRRRSAMHYGSRRVPEDPATAAEMFTALLSANFVFNAAAVRRTALQAVGGFDERVIASEDWELWLRLAASGYNAARAPGLHAIYRFHSDQASRDQVREARFNLFLLGELVANYPGLDSAQATEVRRAVRAARRRLARVTHDSFRTRLEQRSLETLIRWRSLVDWHRRPPEPVAAALASVAPAVASADRSATTK
jgi:glycosyltransferase involved in cell wall biosynthesis